MLYLYHYQKINPKFRSEIRWDTAEFTDISEEVILA